MAIERRCFPHPWSEESFRSLLQDPVFGGFGAFTRTNPLVGYLIYSETADELHILNLAVAPAFRRQGIGEKLLRHLHDEAYRRGRRYAYLEVRDTNVSAQKLYEKFSYRPLTKRRDYYAEDHSDAIVMGARLKKPHR